VISAVNDEIAGIPGVSSTGLKLADLKKGSAVGAGIRVWPKANIVIMADYASLKGSSDDRVAISSSPGSPELKVQVSAPAQAIGLTVGYFFVQPRRWFRLGAGVGGAYYICNGNAGLTLTNLHEAAELRGHGFGGHAMVLGEIRLSDQIHLELAGGYRAAKTGHLTDHGAEVTVDGAPVKADYTGGFARFGFSVPFGPR
jgi:hypothetical protein